MILCVQGPRAVLPAPPPGVIVREVNMLQQRERREDSEPRLGGAPPSPLCRPHNTPPQWDPTEDLRCLTKTFHQLHASGWYWGAISAGEARALLQDAPAGTFLVRDSSHPLYMLTLSVKTERGPTNVRIEYSHGRFRLDSSSVAKPRLLAFLDVPSLVQHYMAPGQVEGDLPAMPAEPLPTPKESAVLLRLVRPLRQRLSCPSLQHLARVTINCHSHCSAQLPLPRPLLLYLQDYPFQL